MVSYKTVCIVLFLILMIQVRVDRSAYFVPYSLPISENNALYWINSHYSNTSYVFLTRPPGWMSNQTYPHFEPDAAAILMPQVTGAIFYQGYLFDLLSARPSLPLNIPIYYDKPIFSDLTNITVLLVDGGSIGTFYRPDIIEKRVLTVLKAEEGWTIYTLKQDLTKTEIEHWNTAWRVFIKSGLIPVSQVAVDDTTFTNWNASQGRLCREFIPTLIRDDGYKGMWISKTFPAIDSSYFQFAYLKCFVNGTGVVAIDFYDNGEVVGTTWGSYSIFTRGNTTYLIDLSNLTKGRPITRIAIVFESTDTVSTLFLDQLLIFN